jgi:hypothetical protein
MSFDDNSPLRVRKRRFSLTLSLSIERVMTLRRMSRMASSGIGRLAWATNSQKGGYPTRPRDSASDRVRKLRGRKKIESQIYSATDYSFHYSGLAPAITIRVTH